MYHSFLIHSSTDGQFLEIYNLPKLNQEELESLNRLIKTSKVEAVIKKLLAHNNPGLDGFTGKFYQTFKEGLTLIFLKLLQKNQEKRRLPNSFYEASIILIPNQVKTEQRKKL